MSEDRSLDEFAVDSESDGKRDAADDAADGADEAVDDGDEGAANPDGGADDEDDAVDDGEPTDDADEAGTADAEAIDADPAVPTATWTTDGAACDRCGDRVARRWIDDGDLVCAACKDW
jgi:hypothetical protein